MLKFQTAEGNRRAWSGPLVAGILNFLLPEKKIKTLSFLDREEGLAEGRAEGNAEGEAKGRASKTDEIARNCKAMGIPINQIAQATGLTPEQVQAL